jgi:hemerythrin-like domain-containing protein
MPRGVGKGAPRALGREGAAMTPTDVLRHEHEVVLLILDAAESEGRTAETGGRPDTARLGRMIDFFRNFVDRCHHAKEERHLFPRVRERSPVAATAPLAVLIREHEEGRRLVKEIADAVARLDAGQAEAVADIAEHVIAYVDLMKAHIDKEDNILFPLAERVLRAEDRQSLLAAFQKIETEELGEGVHEKYHQLAHELAEK